MKTGIMGGTFNPIHEGHYHIAKEAIQSLSLDRVLFMPTGRTYYKENAHVTDEDRAAMILLAIEDEPRFVYSDMEIIQKRNTYTAVTLSDYHRQHPDEELYYIVGADTLCYMDTWFHPEVVFSMATIVATMRDTDPPEAVEAKKRQLEDLYEAKIILLHNSLVPISSSQLRKCLGTANECPAYISPKVFQYIKEHSLYEEES